MPVPSEPARHDASSSISPFVAACAVIVPILVAASLANCTRDDGVAPDCANGGLACLEDASFDAAGFLGPDGAIVLPEASLGSPDAAVNDDGAPAADGAVGIDASPLDAAVDALDAMDAAIAVDAGPQPTKLADASNPYYLTVGGGFVYWSATGNVSRVPVAGGTVTPITSTFGATAMAADANNAYWVGTDGYVYQVAHTSTTPVRIGTLSVQASVIATDGQFVYWSQDGIHSSFFRVPIGGGDAGPITPTVLEYPSGIAFTGGATYLAIANSGNGVAPGTISVLPGDGGLPVSLITGREGPQQLTTDGMRLYWVEDTGLTPNGIFSSAFDGGALFTFTQNELHPKIVTDGTWLYYTDTEYVLKRPADGSGTLTKLYTTSYPWAMAQDADNLYWADRVNNAIYRGAKY